jgi:predicted lactoylglutathione lyase
MATKIFVNLPVKDLSKSVEFFNKLGYSINPQFSDENAASLVISEDIIAMLITEPFFKNFTKKEITDTTSSTEVIVSLLADSREEVDEKINKAVAAGATTPNEPIEMEGMFGRSFDDLDGHHWEYMYMDPSAIKQG